MLAPRKLVSVAGIGKLDNVSAIVYMSSPCCNYHEGAEFEATVTDTATIESVVKQFNSSKMKWSMPAMVAGGNNQKVTFRTANGDKTVKFKNGKVGNFKFEKNKSGLTALLSAVSQPYMYLWTNYNTNFDGDFLSIDSYKEYQDFVSTIKDYDSEQDPIDFDYFYRNKFVAVNLGEGSTYREFFLTKITQTDKGVYLLKIENNYNNDFLNDDAIFMVTLLSLPREVDTTKLLFEVVQ